MGCVIICSHLPVMVHSYTYKGCLKWQPLRVFVKTLSNRFKIRSTVFTKWADIVVWEFIAFVDVTADFADEAFFTFCFRLRLYVFLVVGVGHGVLVTHNTRASCHTDR